MDSKKNSDDVETLRKLARLRDQGILSEEEFQKKKDQILGLAGSTTEQENMTKQVPKVASTRDVHSSVSFTITTTKLEATPGESVETVLKVSNEGTIVDRFHIQVDGLDPTWWTLSIPSFALFPRERGECKLIICPPKNAISRAGVYSFHMKAVSEAEPDVEKSLEGALTVHPFIVWEVEMSPTRVMGKKGTYHITFHNSGNTDMVMTLKGKDPEEALVFNFGKEILTIPAGGSATTDLMIYPKQGMLGRTYLFEVLCQCTTAAGEIRVLNGQIEYRWKHRSRWWWVLIAVGVIVLVFLLVWLIQYFATV